MTRGKRFWGIGVCALAVAAVACAAGLSVVTLYLRKGTAREGGAGRDSMAAFVVRWTGSTDGGNVNVQWSGTATNGLDYQFMPGMIAVPGGDSVVIVRTIDDAAVEPPETVTMKILPGGNYTVGTPSEQTATIESDE